MELLRDPFWQSVGAVTAILALFLYVYVERDKISKLYSEMLTPLRGILGRLGNIFPTTVRSIRIILNALFLSLLTFFIFYAPIFLYGEFHQQTHIDSSTIDRNSVFYGLFIIVWCLSIMTISHQLTIDKLRDQIDYLNRIPGIKELKDSYNRQLFESVIGQWKDLSAELANNHDDSPFAIDLATCAPIDVRDEILIVGCPNRVIYKRMNRKAPSSTTGHDEEYQAWKVDKESIERIVRDHFHVRQISYTLTKQITT